MDSKCESYPNSQWTYRRFWRFSLLHCDLTPLDLTRLNVSPNIANQWVQAPLPLFLGGRFGYFLFFLLGGGEGAVRGARNSIENPRRGGSLAREWGGDGPGGCLWVVLGGGELSIFFGAEMPTKIFRAPFNC